MHVTVIIPALDEQDSIGRVIDAIPCHLVKEVVVVDNGSRDRTAEIARLHGATVLHEPRKGYGAACLKGIAYLQGKPPDMHPDIVVFMDADYADDPDEMPLLIEPLVKGEADLVIGSRMLGKREKGALPPQSVFGNWLASRLLSLFYKQTFTDLGPFRAITFSVLRQLRMTDTNYGWTIEMQIKALRNGFSIKEVPVSYRKRIGKSKISGTLKGFIFAGTKILFTIFKYQWR